MAEQSYKVEGNQILYWNGRKWLVKETCESPEAAEALLAELMSRQR